MPSATQPRPGRPTQDEDAAAGPVPILVYHSICESPPDWIAPFTVSPTVFADSSGRDKGERPPCPHRV